MKALTFLVTVALVTFTALTSQASVQDDPTVATLGQLLKQSEIFGAQPVNFQAVSTDSVEQWTDLANISSVAGNSILKVRIDYRMKTMNNPQGFNAQYDSYLEKLENAFGQVTSDLRAKEIHAIVVKAAPAVKSLQQTIDKVEADFQNR